MRLTAEIVLTLVVGAVVLLVLNSLEVLPKYLMDYLLRSGLVYQGY